MPRNRRGGGTKAERREAAIEAGREFQRLWDEKVERLSAEDRRAYDAAKKAHDEVCERYSAELAEFLEKEGHRLREQGDRAWEAATGHKHPNTLAEWKQLIALCSYELALLYPENDWRDDPQFMVNLRTILLARAKRFGSEVVDPFLATKDWKADEGFRRHEQTRIGAVAKKLSPDGVPLTTKTAWKRLDELGIRYHKESQRKLWIHSDDWQRLCSE